MQLPIDEVLPRLVEGVARHGVAVLSAPTGAGKTTRVPPALLDAGLAGAGAVVMLEPRRLAARAAARRMAAERGGRVGDEVGYRVRFDSRVSAATRIEVVTEGLLLRRLQDDPFLEGVGAVVFDEFHERHLEGDLALAMVRRLRQDARTDLALVVMSATLDGDAVAGALDAPLIVSEGRSFPVDVRYLPPGVDGRLEELVARAVAVLLGDTDGDVLVFLPGVAAIRRCARQLADLASRRDLELVELYGDLPADRQDAALAPAARRRVVLATNVAETSVTLPGVTAVVDSGLARQPRHDPALGLDRLEVAPIAVANTDQRAGRAGRTGPGVCARLWTAAEQRNRPVSLPPEVARLDLSGTLLQVLDWGERDPLDLPWLEAPPEAALARARALLEQLGALRDGQPTSVGRRLARLPVAPRLGRLLLAAADRGVAGDAAAVAALLSERDPWRGRSAAEHVGDCDLGWRVEALDARGAPGSAQALRRVRRQLAGLVRDGRRSREPRADLGRALLDAFPDRLARRRGPGSDRALMASGQGVRLHRASVVREAELFVCLDVQAREGGEAEVRHASAVERAWLDPLALETHDVLRFDRERRALVAARQERWHGLVLAEHASAVTLDERAAAVLAEAAADDLGAALDLSERELVAWRARVACLAEWRPDLELPDVSDAALIERLPELCLGRRSFAELRALRLVDALSASWTHVQRQALEREAPERLAVPSGSQVRLTYAAGRPPVLPVRIQEMFGCTTTPAVAGGRVPVLLHLLGPNHRPQQVTDDLAGFWERTYPLVRKELRRRYPRHAWPEDPLAASPERRPARRRPSDKRR